MELYGKTALVSGASSGLGQAIARRFVREGAQVIGIGRRELRETESFRYLRCDITSEADTTALAEKLEKVDILINCAGVTAIGSLKSTTLSQFRQQFEVNVFGLYQLTRAVLPLLEASEGGVIVNVGSELGARAREERIAYCPSKAAVEMLTRCMAMELAPRIRVNGILPGLMETPMTRDRFLNTPDPDAARAAAGEKYLLGRLCTVEDAVEAALFLASPRSAFITGDMLAVCGGGQFATR